MKKKKIKLEKEILGKIKSGEIQMKARWRFVAEMWEMRALWLLLILAAGLSISGIMYFMHIYNPRELAEFGDIGRSVFLEDFPYYWLLGMIIFWILAAKTWHRLGENYRVTRKKIILVSGVLLVVIIGLVLFLN